jgi:hypothetical protein
MSERLLSGIFTKEQSFSGADNSKNTRSYLFSIKNVADVNSIDSFVSKRNMEEFSVVIMKRFIQKPLGIHHIRTILFSLPVTHLKDLRDFGLDKFPTPLMLSLQP